MRIDSSGLIRFDSPAAATAAGEELDKDSSPLERHLRSLVRFRGGPITLAEYMQEALTHPEYGYYMHRDVFGARGDFVTSPEIRCVLYTGPHTTASAW